MVVLQFMKEYFEMEANDNNNCIRLGSVSSYQNMGQDNVACCWLGVGG